MPHYPLKDVKQLIRDNKVDIQPNAIQTAYSDFGWSATQIKACILKFNDRPHKYDRLKNHFYKTEPHRTIPHTMMDYYKAKSVLQGFDVYTHFYIHPMSRRLVISSLKEL